jgi:hypothetical protein
VAGTFGEYVIFDPVKLAELLRGPDGPVGRRLIEDGERVKQEARRLVGVYKPPDAYSAAHRKRRPGTLRDSIVKRMVSRGGELECLVGSDDPIALLHHEGTVPHMIVPRAKPRLVFYWPKAGGVVSFKRVNHPGTQPNRYLVDALTVLRR